MGRQSQFPKLYDDVLKLSLASLRKDGFFNPNRKTEGIVTWKHQGESTSSIGVITFCFPNRTTIELKYKSNNLSYQYSIDVVKQPSNLGRGEVWYFVCPVTKKKCRKLYCVNGRFLHREAFNGVFYDSQIQSKFYKSLDKTLGAYYRLDRHYEELHRKNFKKTYAGKPTKRYKRLLKEIEKGESVDALSLEKSIYL